MQSRHESTAQWMARAGVLTGFGLVLFLFETLIPRPLPWIKPGLANIATIVALYTLGSTAAWIVSILRCLLGSLIGGTLMNPAFWLSIAGAVASVAAMIVVRRFARRIFSIIGAGMIGAFAHTLAQATVADLMIAGKMRVVVLLPSMLLSALLTGLIVGYASHLIVARIARPMAFQPFAHKSRRDSDTVV